MFYYFTAASTDLNCARPIIPCPVSYYVTEPFFGVELFPFLHEIFGQARVTPDSPPQYSFQSEVTSNEQQYAFQIPGLNIKLKGSMPFGF